MERHAEQSLLAAARDLAPDIEERRREDLPFLMILMRPPFSTMKRRVRSSSGAVTRTGKENPLATSTSSTPSPGVSGPVVPSPHAASASSKTGRRADWRTGMLKG
jgi:hypothetical protein